MSVGLQVKLPANPHTKPTKIPTVLKIFFWLALHSHTLCTAILLLSITFCLNFVTKNQKPSESTFQEKINQETILKQITIHKYRPKQKHTKYHSGHLKYRVLPLGTSTNH